MNIIELAKQAGFQDADWNYTKGLEAFANLVAAHEREACAKVCDDSYFAFVAADVIRERGTT
jgi:ABC-type sugar transport system substrate-binding protein